MATNKIHADGTQLSVAPTNAPNDPVESGDPILLGQLPGVALTDEDDSEVTAQFDGVFDLDVVGNDGSPASISAGDIVYYNTGEDRLDSNSSGVQFGYVLEDVGSGATETVQVKIGY